MSTEKPLAQIAKWISNFQIHEQKLVEEIEAREADLAAKQEALGKLAAELETRRENLSVTRAWLFKFEDLLGVLESTNKPSLDILEKEAGPDLKEKLTTNFERIEAFLYSVRNEPQTIVEIEAGTEIKRSSVSAVLYRTHNEHFVDSYVPNKKGKVWSLKNPDSTRMLEDDPPVPPMNFEELESMFGPPLGMGEEIPF